MSKVAGPEPRFTWVFAFLYFQSAWRGPASPATSRSRSRECNSCLGIPGHLPAPFRDTPGRGRLAAEHLMTSRSACCSSATQGVVPVACYRMTWHKYHRDFLLCHWYFYKIRLEWVYPPPTTGSPTGTLSCQDQYSRATSHLIHYFSLANIKQGWK